MKEITVYKMAFQLKSPNPPQITCIPFERKYFDIYKSIYNTCFYSMRKSLDIKPYNFFTNYAQMGIKAENTFLLLDNDELVGSITCINNTIDDLVVEKSHQNMGIGRQLLLWGICHIRAKTDQPVYLYVAEWNKNAYCLYKKLGFQIIQKQNYRCTE